jgi:hypothetical protein
VRRNRLMVGQEFSIRSLILKKQQKFSLENSQQNMGMKEREGRAG